MAQKYMIQVIDDLDGTELDRDDAEEVRFGVDGRAYAIDLSKANAAGLRDVLARYVDAARQDQAAPHRPTTTGGGRKDLDEVRRWANEHGHTVSNRGRVPNSVLQAYDSAHQSRPSSSRTDSRGTVTWLDCAQPHPAQG